MGVAFYDPVTGKPVYNDTSSTQADLQAGADYTEKMGNRRRGTAAQRGTVSNPVGLEWYETDTGYVWLLTATGWKLSLAGRVPFFRYHKTAPFKWPSPNPGTVVWDALVRGALEGWTYSNGAFTCVIPGEWEWDARAGIVNGSGAASANARWYLNSSGTIGHGGGQASLAYTTHGFAYRDVFAAGDVVEFKLVSTAAVDGVLTDGGNGSDKVQLTWLSCQFKGLY